MTESQAIKDFKPGRYRHYKGGQYIALMLVRHHETDEVFVVYVCCERGTVSMREWRSEGKDSWCDLVTVNPGLIITRFVYQGPAL